MQEENFQIKTVELEHLNKVLEDINYIDFLTKIPNRRKFFKDIYQRVLTEDVELIMMDFNNFKLINDEFGHKRGDEALQFFSETMTEKIKPYNGTLYRLGGDEFAILIDSTNDIIVDELFHSIDNELKAFHKNASMAYGVVLVTKDTCNELNPAEDSMRIADGQMYEMKKKEK